MAPRKTPTPRKSLSGALFRIGLISTLIGLIIIGIAVISTINSLPDFDEMMRSPNGQSVEIRGSWDERFEAACAAIDAASPQ